jgi:hypothetical protein
MLIKAEWILAYVYQAEWILAKAEWILANLIKSRVDSRKCLSKAEWILANVYQKPGGFSQTFTLFQAASPKQRTA